MEEELNNFVAYEVVRRKGDYNMITEAKFAIWSTGLREEEYFSVQRNFETLREKFFRLPVEVQKRLLEEKYKELYPF